MKRSPELKAQAISGFKWNGLFVVSTMLLNGFMIFILGFLFSANDFGLRAIIVFILGLSRIVTDFGISQAIIQHDPVTPSELNSIFTVNILTGAVMCLLVNGLAPFLSLYFESPSLQPLLHFASLLFLMEPLVVVFIALLEKKLAFKALAVLNMNRIALMNGAIILFAFLGFQVYAFIIGQLLAAIYMTLALYLLYRKQGDWLPAFRLRLADLKPYYSFGIYVSGKNVMNYFGRNFDELIVGRLLGLEWLGYYSFAKQALDKVIDLVIQISTKVTYPVFCKIQQGEGGTVLFQQTYLKMTHVVAVLGLPLFALLFLGLPSAVPVVFGDKWEPSIIVMQVLALKGMIDILSAGFATNALYAHHSSKTAFYADLTLLPIRLLSLVVACYYGLTAVAVAYLLFVMLKASVLQWLVNKVCRMSGKAYLLQLASPLSIAGGLAAICYLLTRLGSQLWLAAGILMGYAVAYLVLTYVLDRTTSREIIGEVRTLMEPLVMYRKKKIIRDGMGMP